MVFVWKYLVNVLILLLMFCLPLLFEYWKYKKEHIKQSNKQSFWLSLLDKFGLNKFTWKNLAYGIVLSLGIFALNVLIVSLGTYFGYNDLQTQSKIISDFITMPVLFSIYLLISAIAEEFFFRAFLTTYTGIWFSTLIFAILHFSYGSYFEIVGAFILGLILAIIWKRTRNFYIIAIGHFLQNFYSIILLLMH